MNISLLIWDCFLFCHFYLEISIKTLVSVRLPGGFLFGIEKSGSFKNPSFVLDSGDLMCGCGFLVDVESGVRFSGIWNLESGFIFGLGFGGFFCVWAFCSWF